MQAASVAHLQELESIISKIPLEVCSMNVIPEFGIRWREVARAVRNCRLRMQPSSVARVLSRHAARTFPEEEVVEIIARLRLRLVATQDRNWHVVDLQDPIEEEMSIAHLIQALPNRVAQALRNTRAGRIMSPDVQFILLNDMIFMSVQMISATRELPALYVATPPGQPVALVSSVKSSLLKGCALGLGYRKYEDAQLYGHDIISLLRIHDRNHNENGNHLQSLPPYNPLPVITSNGIDFSNQAYDEKYVDEILGPNPPILTELVITSSKPFYDPTRLNKKINLTVTIKSDNLAKTLKSWVGMGALAPTSELFHIFNKVKSNRITYVDDEDDE